MRNRILVALAAAAFALPGGVAAQASNQGIITATAEVQTPLTVSFIQDLDFGNVLPGVNKTIAPGDGADGRLQVAGASGYQVSLDFGTLPTALLSGGNNLPISFGAGSAGHGTTSGSVGSLFNPGTGANANLSASGNLFIFLGGTVSPAIDQAAGTYEADITVTVDYTGN